MQTPGEVSTTHPMKYKFVPAFCLLLATLSSLFGGEVVINEIHYHPASERVEHEWIESMVPHK